jgi:hypothetical protein
MQQVKYQPSQQSDPTKRYGDATNNEDDGRPASKYLQQCLFEFIRFRQSKSRELSFFDHALLKPANFSAFNQFVD